MSEGTDADFERRAARLLRWYPKGWRDRYEEEFVELLISDMAERPRSLSRTLDVARGGIVARLADAGLCGFPAAEIAWMAASPLALGGAIWAVAAARWASRWARSAVAPAAVSR